MAPPFVTVAIYGVEEGLPSLMVIEERPVYAEGLPLGIDHVYVPPVPPVAVRVV